MLLNFYLEICSRSYEQRIIWSEEKMVERSYTGMSKEIFETDWDKLFCGKDIDSWYALFVEIFITYVKNLFPNQKKLTEPVYLGLQTKFNR